MGDYLGLKPEKISAWSLQAGGSMVLLLGNIVDIVYTLSILQVTKRTVNVITKEVCMVCIINGLSSEDASVFRVVILL